ncbi:hypothetical protein MUP01_02665 [Candidatus Bathyarchaeota archaeon]|nr:hypothetical protein [Candidatus Bathyarchaeota archaeon]
MRNEEALKLLFVCPRNAHRSPLAEALLKKLRPDSQVGSKGLQVGIPVSEQVKEYLSRMNGDQYLKEAPESLSKKCLHEYDIIVAMQQRHKDAYHWVGGAKLRPTNYFLILVTLNLTAL